MIHEVYEPQTRALLGTASHFCKIVVPKLKTVPIGTALSLIILRVIRRGPASSDLRGGHLLSSSLLLSSLELSDTKVYEP